MTDPVTELTALAATYPKFVQAPAQWAARGWSGQNLTEIEALVTSHEIEATVMQAGTNTLLILVGGASYTYKVGEQVVIANDGGTRWRLDPARRNLDGLVPLSDFYVTPPSA